MTGEAIERMVIMQKITPCLWFDTQGEEAANFYTSVFKNSRITDISRYGEAGPRPAGTVMTVAFELDGRQVVPTALSELLNDPDPGRSQRAMKAMLQMSKIDIEAIRKAADADA